MQPDFWLDRWQRGETAFHKPAASQYLSQHWRQLELDPAATVFVPLCGKSLDILWLRDRGHRVVGVELSSLALESFCMENAVPARRRTEPHFDVYEAANLELLCGNFFDMSPSRLANVGAVYDRAALISWNVELRQSYTEHMTRITAAGTRTLLVTLEYPQEQKAGPPFSITADEVERLYSNHHSIEALSREDVLASEPRLRARGITRLHEVCYRLTRL